MSNINQQMTQKTLGHKTHNMTDRYTYLRAESLRNSVNSVSDTMLEFYDNTTTTNNTDSNNVIEIKGSMNG